MSERKTMYRAFFAFNGLSMWSPESPCSAFHSIMELSPCGNWVEARNPRPDKRGYEVTRHEISDYWQPTKELALAVVAPRLRQIGETLIRQAAELEKAAQKETVASS
jgi:hypothetical protein